MDDNVAIASIPELLPDILDPLLGSVVVELEKGFVNICGGLPAKFPACPTNLVSVAVKEKGYEPTLKVITSPTA